MSNGPTQIFCLHAKKDAHNLFNSYIAKKSVCGLQVRTNTQLKKSFSEEFYPVEYIKHYTDVPKSPRLGTFDHHVEFFNEIILGNAKTIGKKVLTAAKRVLGTSHGENKSEPNRISKITYLCQSLRF